MMIWSLAQMADGGYTLIGTSEITYVWLVRTDVLGNMLWNRTYAAGSSTEIHPESLSCTATADGGCVIASGFRYSLASTCDAWAVKTDALGNVEWNKTYGGVGHEVVSSVQRTSDGGYVLAGWAAPFEVNNDDFYLIKIDVNGNAEWNKTYGVASSNEMAWSIQQTTDGGYVLAGESYSSLENRRDVWVVKADTTGNMVWNTTINQTPLDDWVNSIQLTNDGGYIMAGCHYSFGGGIGGFWLIKIDSEGSVQWSRVYGYGGNPNVGGQAYSACQTGDGGYIAVGGETVAGYGGEVEVWLVKTDSYGSMIWNGTYGKGYGHSVIQTGDGGYVFSASSRLAKVMRANPPIVSFTCNPTNASVQQEIVFNASASSDLDEDIVSYVWDFDDGNVSTASGPVISHTYGSPRIYNVTLTITDSEELNSSVSKEVWVRVPTYISMSIVDSAFIGFSVPVSGTLNDMYGNGLKNENVTLQWYLGGNTWALLASGITDDFGNYVIDWVPTALRSYMVRVEWSGNQTFFPAEHTTHISIKSIPTRISVALSSSTSLIGFQIGISGDLISDVGVVSNAPILLSYSVTRGQTWNDITQAYTASDGHYSAVWMPSATGNYLVKALWAGNSTYPEAAKTVNLAVIPFEEQNDISVFSVISNSTVSELNFESVQRELTFTVSGPLDTMGYADVYIAKTLIGNIEGVEVKLNGTEIEYAATSLDDSWLIHITYQHSAHTVAMNLGAPTPPPGETTGIDALTTALLIAVIAVVLLAAGILIRRKRLRKKPSEPI